MNWLRANRLSAQNPLESPSYDLNMRSSVQIKGNPNKSLDHSTVGKIKSNPSFSLSKNLKKSHDQTSNNLHQAASKKSQVRFPIIKKGSYLDENPQTMTISTFEEEVFYQSQIHRALRGQQSSYMINLARQHFYQTIEALRITKHLKVTVPRKQIKLQKKSPHKKTIYLDMDETLIHTDQSSDSYSVKLTFPVNNGMMIQAGVRIRPFCKEFLTQLAQFAEIIIFTASSASYADVILNHLDPERKLFSHRLYRNHCTLEKGYYTKDLRVVNRRLQDVAIVDNSAFSFLLQPDNGIPILPFYHFAKDRELQTLLPYLRELVKQQDCRKMIKKTFFWDAYTKDQTDPKKIFLKKFKKDLQEKYLPIK